MFGAADEAGVDAEGGGGVAEGLEHGRRRCEEPSVDALRSGPDDGGELPLESLAEPADHREGIEAVFFDFLGFLGLAAIEAVEIEDDVGGGVDIGGGAAARARLPDRGRGHGTDLRFILPLRDGAPVVRMAGATVENVAGPDDGILWEERGEEISRVELDQIAVDPLRAVVPYIGRCPWVAGDDLGALFLDGSKEALPFLCLTALCSASLPPKAFVFRIVLLLADNAHVGEDAAVVFPISRHCGANVSVREDGQMISLPVAAILGTGRAAGDDLAAGMADFLNAGEVEAGVACGHAYGAYAMETAAMKSLGIRSSAFPRESDFVSSSFPDVKVRFH